MEINSELQRFQSDLRFLLSIIKRRWRPALVGSGSIFCLAAVFTFIQGPSYEANGKILLEKRNSTSSLTESGKELSDLMSIGSSDPVANEMEVIRSIPIAQKVISELNLKDETGRLLMPETFAEKKMTVKKIRETDVLKISYKSKSAKEAAKVVNRLMSVYIDNSVSTDRSKALERGRFIAKELPVAEAEVRKIEDSIRKFKEINKISDLDAEKRSTAASISAINEKLTDSSTQLRGAISRSKTLQNRMGVEPSIAMEMSSISQTPAVQDVLTELRQSENQLTIARNRYADNHPIILDLAEKVNTLRNFLKHRVQEVVNNQISLNNNQLQTKGVKQALLDDYVKLQVDNVALSTQINSLNHEKSLYLNRVKVLPKLEQIQRELERRLAASQSTYSMLLNKSQEIQIAANQSGGNARIIEYALPPEKIRISPIILKLLLGLLAGGAFGIILTLFLEFNDRSVKTIEEIKDKFGYALLGLIPDFEFSENSKMNNDELESKNLQLIVQNYPSSPISEAYRMLNSNLKFMDTEGELKTIIVTSSVPNEGKSTVSANIALTMAQQGLKVLLIDADMRRSTQHNIWQVRKTFGLSDLLVGQTDLNNSLHYVREGLCVLTAGATPPNPGTLLESKRMVSLLKQFSEEFDMVIIDTPPLLPTNDPRILATIADGIILVARPGLVDSNNSASAKELLKPLEHKILGMVANRVVPQHEPYSYFYYTDEYQSHLDEPSKTVKV